MAKANAETTKNLTQAITKAVIDSCRPVKDIEEQERWKEAVATVFDKNMSLVEAAAIHKMLWPVVNDLSHKPDSFELYALDAAIGFLNGFVCTTGTAQSVDDMRCRVTFLIEAADVEESFNGPGLRQLLEDLEWGGPFEIVRRKRTH